MVVRATENEEYQEDVVKEGRFTVTLKTPAHLWFLGATDITTTVRTLGEASALIGQMQEFWANLETAYDNRLLDVQEYANRASLAMTNYLADLGDEVDPLSISTSEAKRRIGVALRAQQDGEQQEERPQRRRSSGSRPTGRSSGRGARRSTTSGTTRRSSSRRSGGRSSSRRSGGQNFEMTEEQRSEDMTDAQYAALERRYTALDMDVPREVDNYTKGQASDKIQELNDELGWE